MHRQARERIIAMEVMKLERRQALERGREARPRRTSAQGPQDHRSSTRA
jgi:hypothetical protein